MKIHLAVLTLLLMGNISQAKVLVNLFGESAHTSLKASTLSVSTDSDSNAEIRLQKAHLGCNKITVQKSLIEKTSVNHLFIEQKAFVADTAASSVQDLAQFIKKNETSSQTVMIDLTLSASCTPEQMRIRIL